jgi:RNA polymerase sigma factor (sigma-70 family)
VLTAENQPATEGEPGELFDEFYAREFSRIVAVVLMITASRAVAEEVAQEAFTTAFGQWGRVQGLDKPGAWVRRVALNRAKSYRRRLHAERDALPRIGLVAVAVDTTSDREVWTEVSRLPSRQGQVVALRFVEDLTIEQIADVLGVSPGSVKTHLHRALKRLSSRLGKEEGQR